MDSADLSEKSIEDLDTRPLKLLGKDVDVALRHRGKVFWKCRSRCLVCYREDLGNESSHNGDERYMVDLKMYHQLHKKDKRSTANDTGPRPLESR